MSFSGDPFKVPHYLIPSGMVYQWFSMHPDDPQPDLTWEPVPFGRVRDHFGAFAEQGDCVVVMNQKLMQRPKELSDAYIKQCEEKARQNEEDQLQRMKDIAAESGFISSLEISVKRSPR